MLPQIDAVILAAGKSERFGQPKVLQTFLGEPFVSRIIHRLRDSGVRNVSLVLGHNAGEYIPQIPQSGFPYIVINKNYELGQFASLQVGINSVNNNIDGVMLTLIDCPHISSEAYQMVMSESTNYPEKIIIPTYQSKGGHPVYLPAWFFPKIRNADPSDNLRNLFRDHHSSIHRFEVPDEGITQDIDTPEDLAKLERMVTKRFKENSN